MKKSFTPTANKPIHFYKVIVNFLFFIIMDRNNTSEKGVGQQGYSCMRGGGHGDLGGVERGEINSFIFSSYFFIFLGLGKFQASSSFEYSLLAKNSHISFIIFINILHNSFIFPLYFFIFLGLGKIPSYLIYRHATCFYTAGTWTGISYPATL